jgi:hypothetical protein
VGHDRPPVLANIDQGKLALTLELSVHRWPREPRGGATA